MGIKNSILLEATYATYPQNLNKLDITLIQRRTCFCVYHIGLTEPCEALQMVAGNGNYSLYLSLFQ